MLCPRCAHEKTKVVGTVKGTLNERFRTCPACGYAFQTVEVIKADDYPKHYLKSLFEEEFEAQEGKIQK